jgi:hypothetical protein
MNTEEGEKLLYSETTVISKTYDILCLEKACHYSVLNVESLRATLIDKGANVAANRDSQVRHIPSSSDLPWQNLDRLRSLVIP